VSRAGRSSGPAAKKRELHTRLRSAVAAHQEAAEPSAAPPEVPEDVRAQWYSIPPEVRTAWSAGLHLGDRRLDGALLEEADPLISEKRADHLGRPERTVAEDDEVLAMGIDALRAEAAGIELPA